MGRDLYDPYLPSENDAVEPPPLAPWCDRTREGQGSTQRKPVEDIFSFFQSVAIQDPKKVPIHYTDVETMHNSKTWKVFGMLRSEKVGGSLAGTDRNS